MERTIFGKAPFKSTAWMGDQARNNYAILDFLMGNLCVERMGTSERKIFWAEWRGEKIVPGSIRRVETPEGEFTHPALSPDGRWIAFWGLSGGSAELWIAGTAGGPAKQLTHSGGVACHPGWSPDSTKVAYACNPKFDVQCASGSLYDAFEFAPREIWEIEVGTGEERPVLADGRDHERPAYSPDGLQIAHVDSSGGGESRDIWIFDIAKGERGTGSVQEFINSIFRYF